MRKRLVGTQMPHAQASERASQPARLFAISKFSMLPPFAGYPAVVCSLPASSCAWLPGYQLSAVYFPKTVWFEHVWLACQTWGPIAVSYAVSLCVGYCQGVSPGRLAQRRTVGRRCGTQVLYVLCGPQPAEPSLSPYMCYMRFMAPNPLNLHPPAPCFSVLYALCGPQPEPHSVPAPCYMRYMCYMAPNPLNPTVSQLLAFCTVCAIWLEPTASPAAPSWRASWSSSTASGGSSRRRGAWSPRRW